MKYTITVNGRKVTFATKAQVARYWQLVEEYSK